MNHTKASITIIIPVHANRHDFLKRILEYYSGYDIPILICDSSTKRFKKPKKYKHVKYYHYPNKAYAVKLHDILKKVKTRYCVLCAVDDFIIPEAIDRCVTFLNKNKDYSSVQGRYVSFYKIGKRVIHGPSFTEIMTKNVNGTTCLKRMKQQLKPYSEIIYCVMKTKVLKDSFNKEGSEKIKDYNLWELICTLTAVIDGKHRVLPIFYGARESMADSGANYTVELDRFVKQKDNIREYQDFIKILSKKLAKKEKILISDAKKKIIRVIDGHISTKIEEHSRLSVSIIETIDNSAPRIGKLIKDVYFEGKRIRKKRDAKKIKGYPFCNEEDKKKLQKIDRLILKHDVETKWRTIQI